MVQNIDQDKLIVTQANKLAEASYTMSLEEKRIVLLMVSLVRKDDKDFHSYRIPITEIRDFLGLENDKDLYGRLKKVSLVLRSRSFIIEKPNGGYLSIGWVSSAEYKPKGEDGADVACLELCFDPKLKPYLLALIEQYSSFTLQNVAGLRSFYSIRIYELLNSRRRLKRAAFKIEELKNILKAEGKYENYKDFRKYVLLVAQKELAEKTDIAFEFEDDAVRGRKVTSITFHIRDNEPTNHPRSIVANITSSKLSDAVPAHIEENQPQLLPPTEAEKENARLYHEALAEGMKNSVSERVMRDLLNTRNPAHVMENIEIARKRHMSAKGDNVNLAGLTVSAITDDYAAPGREKRTAAAAKKTNAQRKKAAAELIDRIHEAVQRQRRTETIRFDQEHGAGSAARMEFEAEMAGGSYAGMFEARGWKMAGISPLWHGFLARRFLPSEADQRRAYAATLGQDYDELCRLAPPK